MLAPRWVIFDHWATCLMCDENVSVLYEHHHFLCVPLSHIIPFEESCEILHGWTLWQKSIIWDNGTQRGDGALKAQIRSCHTSNKTYNLWVEYTQGLNPIIGWYYGCRSGAHTLGFCAHVASVLWYLRYYCNETENSETKLSKVNVDYVKDAAVDTWIMSGNSGEDE